MEACDPRTWSVVLQLRWRRVIHAHGPRREGAWGVCGVDFEPRNLQKCVRGECVVLILSLGILLLQLRWTRVIRAHRPRREGAWGMRGVDLSECVVLI